MCDHLHETSSRYDVDAKLLTFLLECPVCGTEMIVETIEYEPRFKRIYPVPNHEHPSFPDVAAGEPLRRAA